MSANDNPMKSRLDEFKRNYKELDETYAKLSTLFEETQKNIQSFSEKEEAFKKAELKAQSEPTPRPGTPLSFNINGKILNDRDFHKEWNALKKTIADLKQTASNVAQERTSVSKKIKKIQADSKSIEDIKPLEVQNLTTPLAKAPGSLSSTTLIQNTVQKNNPDVQMGILEDSAEAQLGQSLNGQQGVLKGAPLAEEIQTIAAPISKASTGVGITQDSAEAQLGQSLNGQQGVVKPAPLAEGIQTIADPVSKASTGLGITQDSAEAQLGRSLNGQQGVVKPAPLAEEIQTIADPVSKASTGVGITQDSAEAQLGRSLNGQQGVLKGAPLAEEIQTIADPVSKASAGVGIVHDSTETQLGSGIKDQSGIAKKASSADVMKKVNALEDPRLAVSPHLGQPSSVSSLKKEMQKGELKNDQSFPLTASLERKDRQDIKEGSNRTSAFLQDKFNSVTHAFKRGSQMGGVPLTPPQTVLPIEEWRPFFKEGISEVVQKETVRLANLSLKAELTPPAFSKLGGLIEDTLKTSSVLSPDRYYQNLSVEHTKTALNEPGSFTIVSHNAVGPAQRLVEFTHQPKDSKVGIQLLSSKAEDEGLMLMVLSAKSVLEKLGRKQFNIEHCENKPECAVKLYLLGKSLGLEPVFKDKNGETLRSIQKASDIKLKTSAGEISLYDVYNDVQHGLSQADPAYLESLSIKNTQTPQVALNAETPKPLMPSRKPPSAPQKSVLFSASTPSIEPLKNTKPEEVKSKNEAPASRPTR